MPDNNKKHLGIENFFHKNKQSEDNQSSSGGLLESYNQRQQSSIINQDKISAQSEITASPSSEKNLNKNNQQESAINFAKDYSPKGKEKQLKDKSKIFEERHWRSRNTNKVNLIKDQVVLFVNWQEKILILILSIILSMLVVILAYEQILVWEKRKNDEVKVELAEYRSINFKVAKGEEEIKKILEFNKKLALVRFMLENHLYWTNLFKYFEDYTMKQVYFLKFEGKDIESGKYIIPAIARDINIIPTQIKWFQRNSKTIKADTVGNAEIQNIIEGEKRTGIKGDRVKFDLELTIDPKIFIINPALIELRNNK